MHQTQQKQQPQLPHSSRSSRPLVVAVGEGLDRSGAVQLIVTTVKPLMEGLSPFAMMSAASSWQGDRRQYHWLCFRVTEVCFHASFL